MLLTNNSISKESSQLQRDIIELFASKFAHGAKCLYAEASGNAHAQEINFLKKIGMSFTRQDEMPDVILFDEEKNRLFLVDAVTSNDKAMNTNRVTKLNDLTKNVTTGKIYVSAFPDFKTYKNSIEEIVWGTNVWIASVPEHMIHFDSGNLLKPFC
jgi:BsuBI/PstI restriction endonuclease C-terminus.